MLVERLAVSMPLYAHMREERHEGPVLGDRLAVSSHLRAHMSENKMKAIAVC